MLTAHTATRANLLRGCADIQGYDKFRKFVSLISTTIVAVRLRFVHPSQSAHPTFVCSRHFGISHPCWATGIYSSSPGRSTADTCHSNSSILVRNNFLAGICITHFSHSCACLLFSNGGRGFLCLTDTGPESNFISPLSLSLVHHRPLPTCSMSFSVSF